MSDDEICGLDPYNTPPPKSEPFEHVMIDIETMSLHTHNALILSIGLLEFDPTGDRLRLGNRSLLRPEIIPQLLLGREVASGTQKFWMGQSQDAIDDWADGERDTLDTVFAVVKGYTENAKGVWARGDIFDLGNVASLIQQVGKPVPWHYRAPSCMRGFLRERPLNPNHTAFPDVSGVPHAALFDCEAQAWEVWSHWPEPEQLMHHPV